jgi:tetratricopeptide (TPR) repeat protein
MKTLILFCLLSLLNGLNYILAQDIEAIWNRSKDFVTDAQKVAYYTRQIEIYPNCKELYSWRAMYKEFLHDFRGAMNDYNLLVQLDPNDAKSYSLRANFKYQYLDDYDGAIADINQALRISPNEQKYFHARAIHKWQSGSFKSAIIDFDKAVELAENKIDNFTLGRMICGRGECKLKIGDINGACEDWSRAGELGYSAYDLIKKYCRQTK